MKPTQSEIIACMLRYGGSFVSALAHAWQVADHINRMKLELTFESDFARYEELVTSLKQNETNETTPNETTQTIPE